MITINHDALVYFDPAYKRQARSHYVAAQLPVVLDLITAVAFLLIGSLILSGTIQATPTTAHALLIIGGLDALLLIILRVCMKSLHGGCRIRTKP